MYKPLSKQQADEMSRPALIDDGKYNCLLMEFSNSDKYGKTLVDSKGEPMTRIKLKIWDMNNKERFVFTNLYWGENNRMSFRTRHFAESFQVLPLYESGELYNRLGECLELDGTCEIYTQKSRPKNDGTNEMWPAKNDVRDFLENKKTVSTEKVDDFEDSIPF